MSDELKPCPFCGTAAVTLRSGGAGCSFVLCEGCQTTGPDRIVENAIAAWNRRTDTIPSAAYVAGLADMLRRAKEELRLIRMKDTGAVYDVLLRTEIDAALASRPASPDVRVKVKPLVWRKQSGTCEIAETPWGAVAVQDESHALAPKRWGWWMVGSGEDDSPSGYGIDIEAAKAAAQADYERRILSAIIGGQP